MLKIYFFPNFVKIKMLELPVPRLLTVPAYPVVFQSSVPAHVSL